MRVLKWLVVGLIGLVALGAVVGLLLPSTWNVERTVSIAAEPETIRPFLDTPRQWPVWSAWNTARYPDMVVAYEGPERGPGAAWKWEGESSGAGRLEITRSEPGQGVEYRLAFADFPPIDGAMRLERAGAATTVRWTMAGDVGRNLVARYFAPFMDDMMVEELDEGLAKLKRLAEGAPVPAAPAPAALGGTAAGE